MPALQNPRHERFAQNLAKGMHQGKAYKDAGYSAAYRSSSSLLARKQHIRARVDEILKARGEAATQTFVAVERKFELTRQWVVEKLVKNAEIALGERPIQHRGEAEYRYDGAVAARSLELLGREVGLFVERKQIDVIADVKRLSDAELLQQIRETAGELLELTAEDATPEDEFSPEAIEQPPVEENKSEGASPTVE